MADQSRYLDGRAASGGDGTTAALTGANCAFNTLSALQVAADAGKSGTDRWLVYLQGPARFLRWDLTTSMNSSKTNPIRIIATGQWKHAGVYDPSLPRIVSTVAGGTYASGCVNFKTTVGFTCGIEFVGVQFEQQQVTGDDAPVFSDNNTAGSMGATFYVQCEDCIFHYSGSDPKTHAAGGGCRVWNVQNSSASGWMVGFINCIAYGFCGWFNAPSYSNSIVGHMYMYNCDGYYMNPGLGYECIHFNNMDTASSTLRVINTFMHIHPQGAGSGMEVKTAAFTTTQQTNFKSDNTGTITGWTNNAVPVFVSPLNLNYPDLRVSLLDTVLRGVGTNISSGDPRFNVTVDMLGVTRQSTPTVGPFEYAASLPAGFSVPYPPLEVPTQHRRAYD